MKRQFFFHSLCFALIDFIPPSSPGAQAPANDISCHCELSTNIRRSVCERTRRDNIIRRGVGYRHGTMLSCPDVPQFEANGTVERLQ